MRSGWVPIKRLRAAFNQEEIGWTGGENDREKGVSAGSPDTGSQRVLPGEAGPPLRKDTGLLPFHIQY